MIRLIPNLTTPYRIAYAAAGVAVAVTGVFRATTKLDFALYLLGAAILLAESVSGF